MKRSLHIVVIAAVLINLLLNITNAYSQASTANYVFTATSNGTLTDMSTGTTTLITSDVDGLNTGTFSIANNIGFAFYFMGKEYTQFVATEDGVIRLGSSLNPINRVPDLEVNEPRIIPFSCDMRTGNNGKVHYKIIGSEPNRIFVIEWSQMILAYTLESQTGRSTFQLRLYESSNKIEFVYGYMYTDIHRAGQEDFGGIGFSDYNATNGIIYKTGTFNNTNVARTSPSTAILPALITTTGEIAGLSSTSDGYRMVYKFVPIAPPAAPTNLTFTAITQSDITLNWTDNSSTESYYLIYRSEDGGLTYDLVATENANTTSKVISGLPSKSYYFKVIATNEGGASSPLTGNTSTLSSGSKVSNVVTGNWSDPNSWSPVGVPVSTDDVLILNGNTIIIDDNTAVCNNITIGLGASGTLQFAGGSSNAVLTADGDVTVSNGATFDVVAGATGGTRKLIIGNRLRSNSNLTVHGTFDMQKGGSSVAEVEFRGTSNGTISGSGSVCNFYAITVNKGTTNTAIIEATRIITITEPTSAANLLVLTNGTFKLSSASNLKPYFGNATIVSATSRLWLNNALASVECVNTGTSITGAGNATISNGGILQISAGTFGYGAGANVLTINGTVKLESASAVLNQFGRFFLPNSGYLIMSAGNINIDPRAASDLSNNTLEFEANSFALVTGGTITLVDPLNTTSYYDFLIPNQGEQNKNFIGSTLRLGDGTSSTNGSTNGFVISFPSQYKGSLGNIEVNNPAGTNRFVSIRKTDGHANNNIIQGLTITAGTFRLYTTSSVAYTLDVYGNIINNGMLDASISSNRIHMNGSTTQTYSGSGSISATNNLELQINNRNGVTLNAPLTLNTLVLTTGKLNTDNTNILTLLPNTNTAAGSASSYVNGPLKRILPAGSNTITFPVGKGSYNMLELVNANTTANDVVVVAEVIDANCGGSYTNGDYILNSNRYWKLNITTNSSHFTNANIRITEVGTTTGQLLTRCSTVNGTYTTFSDGTGTSGYTIISNSTISSANTENYFAVASNYMTGTYSVGSGQAYTSLTGATGGFFAAVNSAGLRGNVIANITSDITETGEIALNQWNEANGSGFTLTVQSSSTTPRTLSGNVNKTSAGGYGAMIRINGADKLIFDGTTGKYLILTNNTTNASNTSSTIELLNGTNGTQINNCIIENHNNSATDQGVITIGSGANSNITISGNDIRGATIGYINYPFCAIYGNNTTNSAVTISGNNIYNFRNYGLFVENAGDGWQILNNHLYKTFTDDLSAISQTGIYLNGGSNHQINGNFIGGQDINCGGSAWTNNNSSPYIKGIEITVGTSIASVVKGNTISNFNIQNTSGSNFTGIQVNDGTITLGNSEGNIISNITSGASSVYGLSSATNSSIIISNNTIRDITATNTSATTVLKGIVHSSGSSANIDQNTIYALSCAGTSTDIVNQTVSGIYCSGEANQPEIHNNTIYNLLASHTGSIQTNVSAISVHSAISGLIYRNRIYDIKNASTLNNASTPPTASGIVLYTLSTSIQILNNLISLGNSQTTNTGFYAIWLNGQPASSVDAGIYYNSAIIDGVVSAGDLNSFCILRGNNSTSSLSNYNMDALNNILANRRSGGTGHHYSLGNQGTNPTGGWGTNGTNYNLLVAGNSSYIGFWNATSYGFTDWTTSINTDKNSIYFTSTAGSTDANNLNLTNLFTDIPSANLNIQTSNPECWAANGNALAISAVATDYNTNMRNTLIQNGATDCGACEFIPASAPIPAIQSGTIADGSTTTYTLAGRILAEITWHGPSSPSFPTVQLWYYSGTNPTDDAESTLASTQYSNSFWRITATGGNIATYTYDLTLYYADNILQTIADESILNIVKNPVIFPLPTSTPQNVWRTYNSTVNNAVNNYVTIEGIIGFSDFALESGLIPLPIQLTRFDAIANDGNVLLNWETASETNNQFFTIEKSINLNGWLEVGRVTGAGNSSDIRQYQITDYSPFKGISYYRLKQTDYNGNFTYSDIRTIKMYLSETGGLKVYFNETHNQLVIENETGEPIQGLLTIFDTKPKQLFSKDNEWPVGISTVPVNGVSNGFYMVTLRTIYGIINTKLVIN